MDRFVRAGADNDAGGLEDNKTQTICTTHQYGQDMDHNVLQRTNINQLQRNIQIYAKTPRTCHP